MGSSRMLGRWLRVLAVVGALTLAFPFVSATPVAADTRCNGSAGTDVYEDINRGGRSARMCGAMNRSDYRGWNDNLFFFESWNDRVSSYQVFNYTDWKICFWMDPDYQTDVLCTYNTSGETVSNLGDWTRNDRITSSKQWHP